MDELQKYAVFEIRKRLWICHRTSLNFSSEVRSFLYISMNRLRYTAQYKPTIMYENKKSSTMIWWKSGFRESVEEEHASAQSSLIFLSCFLWSWIFNFWRVNEIWELSQKARFSLNKYNVSYFSHKTFWGIWGELFLYKDSSALILAFIIDLFGNILTFSPEVGLWVGSCVHQL